MKERTLLAKVVDHLHRITPLPEQVAEVAVRTDLFANGLAQLDQRVRVVGYEAGMHLDGNLLDPVRPHELHCFPPVRDDDLLPLPGDDFVVVGGPAVSDPVWVLGRGRISRAT